MLVAGGFDGTTANAPLALAELYDPNSGSWTPTGSMLEARYDHTATLLPNGMVLVAGGARTNGAGLASSELYDPVTGTWTTTGNMSAPRVYHTATLLANGKVLVAGSFVGSSEGVIALASAELYDPATGSWTPTGSMDQTRGYHTATLLNDGTVLVAGGSGGGPGSELYDPSSGSWTPTGSMVEMRSYHTATLLPDGTVLVAGGGTTIGQAATAELYEPSSRTWTSTGPMVAAALERTATLLLDGTVLVTGGYDPSANGLASAELYDPKTGAWTANRGNDRRPHLPHSHAAARWRSAGGGRQPQRLRLQRRRPASFRRVVLPDHSIDRPPA